MSGDFLYLFFISHSAADDFSHCFDMAIDISGTFDLAAGCDVAPDTAALYISTGCYISADITALDLTAGRYLIADVFAGDRLSGGHTFLHIAID